MPFQSHLHHTQTNSWPFFAFLIQIRVSVDRNDSISRKGQEQEGESGKSVQSSPAEPAITEMERTSSSTSSRADSSPEQHAAEADAFYRQMVGLGSYFRVCGFRMCQNTRSCLAVPTLMYAAKLSGTNLLPSTDALHLRDGS